MRYWNPRFLLLVLVVVCVACSPTRPKRSKAPADQPVTESTAMPRADPAYLQYLERNSMLVTSAERAKVVSGSELGWRPSSNDGTADSLLNFADVWLAVHPLTLLTSSRNTVFSQLADSRLHTVLREVGIRGLFVAPIQGGGAVWAKERKGVDTGDDVVQYDFSRTVGKETQYHRLMESAIDKQLLLGSDLLPAATGIGPDFFLAARNVREYPGIYCMVDIPEELWTALPASASEWEGAALSAEQIVALNAKGFLPKAMRDETASLGRKGGWAATGKVRGVDGSSRRWVYRYYKNPQHPVLNWDDPSQTASRILSGSAVQQVGLQGQALVGLRFEAFQGLEASHGEARAGFGIEPALTAAQSMSRKVGTYGGWAFLRDDNLPLNALKRFTDSGTDFVFDSVFSPAAEHALLTGDASLLRFMADEMIRLHIDGRRLAHALPSQDGINYSLPQLAYLAAGSKEAAAFRQRIQGAMRAAVAGAGMGAVSDNYLYTTSAGLAAIALKSSSNAKEMAKGHRLLVFFKAMQPGLLMLSGQDLVGLMPLAASPDGDPANVTRGSYALTSAGDGLVVTDLGMAKAPQIYEAPDMQAHDKDSFVSRIGLFLRARAQYGVARATLVARPKVGGKGCIALLSRMPDGKSYLLSVSNFSRKPVSESFAASELEGAGAGLSRVTPIATGGSHSVAGGVITVNLGPWQGRALLIGGGSGKNDAAPGDPEAGPPTPIPAEE